MSGSGKSTLVNETLYPILVKELNRARAYPLEYESISGLNLTATSTTLFSAAANFSILCISASDSILKARIFLFIPAVISSFDFAIPVKIIFLGSPNCKTIA